MPRQSKRRSRSTSLRKSSRRYRAAKHDSETDEILSFAPRITEIHTLTQHEILNKLDKQLKWVPSKDAVFVFQECEKHARPDSKKSLWVPSANPNGPYLYSTLRNEWLSETALLLFEKMIDRYFQPVQHYRELALFLIYYAVVDGTIEFKK
jgi:hypothetical protein